MCEQMLGGRLSSLFGAFGAVPRENKKEYSEGIRLLRRLLAWRSRMTVRVEEGLPDPVNHVPCLRFKDLFECSKYISIFQMAKIEEKL